MIAQLVVSAVMAWTGWVWLTPIPAAFTLSQLPLAIVVAGWLLSDPPAAARLLRPPAQLVRRPTAVVVRAADVPTLAAWRARNALTPDQRAA